MDNTISLHIFGLAGCPTDFLATPKYIRNSRSLSNLPTHSFMKVSGSAFFLSKYSPNLFNNLKVEQIQ